MTKQQLTEEEFNEWLVESRTPAHKYAKKSTLFDIEYSIASKRDPMLAEILLVNQPVKAENFYEPKEYYSSDSTKPLFTLGKNPKGEDLYFDSLRQGNLFVFGKDASRNSLLESFASQSLNMPDKDLTSLYVVGKDKMKAFDNHLDNPKVKFLSSFNDTVEALIGLKSTMIARYDEMSEAGFTNYLDIPSVGDHRAILIIQNIGDMIRQDEDGIFKELVGDIVRLSRPTGVVLVIGAETLEDIDLIPNETFTNLGNKIIAGTINEEEKDRLIVKGNDRPITIKYYSGEKGTGLFCSYGNIAPLTLPKP